MSVYSPLDGILLSIKSSTSHSSIFLSLVISTTLRDLSNFEKREDFFQHKTVGICVNLVRGEDDLSRFLYVNYDQVG